MTAEAVRAVHIGPEGPPERSLGWQAMQWASEYLLQPDGPLAGSPWRFTREQARFIAWWYATEEDGRFLYRYGVLRRMKGWGKDPFAAVLSCIEFLGPCRFGGEWSGSDPIGVSHPNAWVQIAAVTKDQTRNTMTLFPAMLSARAMDEYAIDLGKEIIYAHRGRCRLEAVTSSPRALEGGRPTFQLKNETQHWLRNNEGHAMAEVIARNLAKSRDGSARALAITNAHRLGEDSDAERDHEAWRTMERGDAPVEMLYDSLEAPERTEIADQDSLRAGLIAARGDSEWVPVERLIGEMQDPRADESRDRRFYLNQIRADAHAWLRADEWSGCQAEERVVEPGALVALGFDGSRNRDTTALVATEVETGYQWVVRAWDCTEAEPEVPIFEVDAALEDAMERYDVYQLNADPYLWAEPIAWWVSKWPDRVVSFDTTQYKRMALAIKAYENAVRTGELTHAPDARFAQHVANCVKRELGFRDEDGEPLYVLAKDGKNSPRKIDVAMAAVLSWEARNRAVAAGWTTRRGLIL